MRYLLNLAAVTAALLAFSNPTGLEAKLPPAAPATLRLEAGDPHRYLTRISAITYLSRGEQDFQHRRYVSAFKNFQASMALFEQAKDPKGDLGYAEATLSLGKLFYEVSQNSFDGSTPKTNFLKLAIKYFALSKGEYEHYIHNNSQLNRNLMHSLTMVNVFLASSYLDLGDLETASIHAIELVKLDPTGVYVVPLVKILSALPAESFKEMIPKIKSSLPEVLADEIIKSITNMR